MHPTARTARHADPGVLVQVQRATTSHANACARRFPAHHHHLGNVRAGGEQPCHALTDAPADWLGGLVFCAASRPLRARDRWIGWREEPRGRRLPLVLNHCRFLLRPHKNFPNLGSRSLRLALDQLRADWHAHPVARADEAGEAVRV